MSVTVTGALTVRGLGRMLSADAGGQCILNLADMTFIEPSGLVALAAICETAAEAGTPVEIVPPRSSDCSNYLERMGLGEAWESMGIDNPLRSVTRGHVESLSELRRFRGEGDLTNVAETIIRLYREAGGEIAEPLYQALFETAANAVEHSQVGGGWVALQQFPQRGQVAVAIADAGIGLRASLAAPTDAQSIARAAHKHESAHIEPGRGRGITSVINLTRDYGGYVAYVTGDATGVFTNGHWDPRVTQASGRLRGTLVETRLGQRREQ